MVLSAYYNEIDSYSSEWLRNLIVCGLIADGEVDTRSIEDVRPTDLRGFTQCHFFAGIGIWSAALRGAGWGDSRPVWTGSCPCQPFSSAGKGGGMGDERHLWPAWLHLISECRPAVLFGEQVASKDAASWLDLVHTDLETLDYAFGAIPFPAACVGAPHIRDRMYWVAHDGQQGRRQVGANAGGRNARALGHEFAAAQRGGGAGGLGDAGESGRQQERRGSLGDEGADGREPDGNHFAAGSGAVDGWWAGADWIPCRDGKARPVEPGTFPLVNGAVSRVGRLRAYGNAIVQPQAEVWIKTVMEHLAC